MVNQTRHEKEAESPAQDAGEYEDGEVDPEDTGGDGEHLVGDGREAGYEDGPKTPVLVITLHGGEAFGGHTGYEPREEKFGHRVPYDSTEAVAENPTQDRRDRGDRGKPKGPTAGPEAKCDEERIRWEGKN